MTGGTGIVIGFVLLILEKKTIFAKLYWSTWTLEFVLERESSSLCSLGFVFQMKVVVNYSQQNTSYTQQY